MKGENQMIRIVINRDYSIDSPYRYLALSVIYLAILDSGWPWLCGNSLNAEMWFATADLDRDYLREIIYERLSEEYLRMGTIV